MTLLSDGHKSRIILLVSFYLISQTTWPKLSLIHHALSVTLFQTSCLQLMMSWYFFLYNLMAHFLHWGSLGHQNSFFLASCQLQLLTAFQLRCFWLQLFSLAKYWFRPSVNCLLKHILLALVYFLNSLFVYAFVNYSQPIFLT